MAASVATGSAASDQEELAVEEFIAQIHELTTAANAANANDEASDVRLNTIVSPGTAIKFLYARKFDVKRAISLYEQHELIRQREHLDQLQPAEEPLHTELSTGKFTILPGRDTSGAAIALFTANLHTPLTVTHQTTLQGVVYQLDVALQNLDTQRSGLVFIYDMSSSKYSNFDYDLSQKILTLLKGGYPARLKKVLIVTAPLWFKAPFKILRLFVREKLRERVFTVSVPQLSLHVPRGSLPQHLGGAALDINHSEWLRHCERVSMTTRIEDELLANVHVAANSNLSSNNSNNSNSLGTTNHHLLSNSNLSNSNSCGILSNSNSCGSSNQHLLLNGDSGVTNSNSISSIPSTECLASNLSGAVDSLKAATISAAAATAAATVGDQSTTTAATASNANGTPSSDNNSSSSASPTSPPTAPVDPNNPAAPADADATFSPAAAAAAEDADVATAAAAAVAQQQLLFELWSENPPSSASSGFSDDDSLAGADADAKTIAQVVDMVRERGRHGLQREYSEIRERAPEGSFQAARQRANLTKNRYTDVLCYDHSRVVLSRDPADDEFADYINANFVDGYKQRNAYISTQGPLPKTTPDFWRMVWEQHCLVIVMTTRVLERGRVKCHQYWETALGAQAEYGPFSVQTLAAEAGEDYTVTKLKVTNNKTDEWRIVSHWQFTSWPDYGVPSSAEAMLNFLQKCREQQAQMVMELGDTWAGHPRGPPMVVHCSAGIGRTGTFITLDICISRLEDVRTVDIRGTVEKIRSQRAYSIQMPDQYVFCHLAFIEYALNRGFLQPGSTDLKGFDGNDDDSE